MWGLVFIARERGPKASLRFPLGCNWKESRRGRMQGPGQGGPCAGARRVTSGAPPQVPLPFLGVWKPSPRHFGREAARALRRTTLAL